MKLVTPPPFVNLTRYCLTLPKTTRNRGYREFSDQCGVWVFLPVFRENTFAASTVIVEAE